VQQILQCTGNVIRPRITRDDQIVFSQPPAPVDTIDNPASGVPYYLNKETAVDIEFHGFSICFPDYHSGFAGYHPFETISEKETKKREFGCFTAVQTAPGSAPRMVVET
jgi:hypothetical protein